MLKYYSEHLHDKEFDRSAEITWRELVVEKSHYPNPADARRKAEALLARLGKGEDFAKLARNDSEGPSRVRAQGGLMQTSPGQLCRRGGQPGAREPASEQGQPDSRGAHQLAHRQSGEPPRSRARLLRGDSGPDPPQDHDRQDDEGPPGVHCQAQAEHPDLDHLRRHRQRPQRDRRITENSLGPRTHRSPLNAPSLSTMRSPPACSPMDHIIKEC